MLLLVHAITLIRKCFTTKLESGGSMCLEMTVIADYVLFVWSNSLRLMKTFTSYLPADNLDRSIYLKTRLSGMLHRHHLAIYMMQ